MDHSINKLLSIASEPICGPLYGEEALNKWGTRGKELAEMLKLKNGFYAYESALLVRPFRQDQTPMGLLEWNDPQRWKAEYVEDLSTAFFFAEDVFGGQHCIREDTICTFDPETGPEAGTGNYRATLLNVVVVDDLMARMGAGDDSLSLDYIYGHNFHFLGEDGWDRLTKTSNVFGHSTEQTGWEDINGEIQVAPPTVRG